MIIFNYIKEDKMKRLNKKGFTLIELLAVIIILGVLLLIAVPSVSRYIQQSRIKTYKSNLSKLVDAVSIEVNSYSDEYQFGSGEYLVVPFACIDLERGSNIKSTFSEYLAEKSYVVVTRNSNGFTYKVTAIDNSGFGAKLAETESIVVEAIDDAETIPSITRTGDAGSYKYSVTTSETGTPKILTCSTFVSKVFGS